jgi:hypothetical protein
MSGHAAARIELGIELTPSGSADAVVRLVAVLVWANRLAIVAVMPTSGPWSGRNSDFVVPRSIGTIGLTVLESKGTNKKAVDSCVGRPEPIQRASD